MMACADWSFLFLPALALAGGLGFAAVLAGFAILIKAERNP